MSALGRKLLIAAVLALAISLPPPGGPASLAARAEPPEGAKAFAEQFSAIVEELVFQGRPGDWGFREEKGSITFSSLHPVHSLNADFALGKSDLMLANRQPTWVAVIFQDGEPVNAIGTRQSEDGNFGLDALGYPPELVYGLLNLQDGEVILHVPPADAYYVYAETAGILTKLGFADGTSVPGHPMGIEQFRNMLTDLYGSADERAKRPGPGYALFGAVVIMALSGIAAWAYFRRRSHANRLRR